LMPAYSFKTSDANNYFKLVLVLSSSRNVEVDFL